MSCSPTRCLIRGSIVLSMAILWPTRLFVFICARWVKRCNKPKTILFILGLIPGLSMEHKFAPQTNKDRFLGINCQGRPQPHPHPETEPQKISFFCYNLCSWKTFFFTISWWSSPFVGSSFMWWTSQRPHEPYAFYLSPCG